MTDFQFDQDKKGGVNLSVPPSKCRTCGGDRYVTVRLRSAEQTVWMDENKIRPSKNFYEEVAPCYTCNRAAYETITWPRIIDPALAEQMHRG